MDLNTKLLKKAEPLCHGAFIDDVRVGLGYTCVELSDGRAGLAWTPEKEQGSSCTKLSRAGTLIGLQAEELLQGLLSVHSLNRAIGLAVCNALNLREPRNYVHTDAIELLRIKADDQVLMVGYFEPLVPRIRALGCRLDILELDTAKPGITDPWQKLPCLARCNVAIITSTSIVTNTINDLLNGLQNISGAVMLGPSTPLYPEAFAGTGITQLSGIQVLDNAGVKNIVSQGGGTKLLKKHLKFVSLEVKGDY